MRKIIAAGALLLALAAVPTGVAIADSVPATSSAPPANQAAFVKSLRKQTGDVTIPAADAVLHLGTKYYFLGPDDAKKVLVDLWGNPPSSVSDVLGLVMPADKSVLENSWGAVITWDDSGYVTDDDADSADYDKIMADMKEGEGAINAERQKAGYPAMSMVGWAQPPSYDKTTHSLIWARDFRIFGESTDSLNYDVRLLGRKGVLSMNMLWDMPHLAEVRAAAQDFGKVATFTTGSTYAEYNSGTDKAAGYGLAGLVGLGVGVAVAKKLGFLGLLLVFGKKFFVIFAVAGAAIAGWFRKLFGRNKDTLEDEG